jgi:hypothetical protein
MGELQVQVDFFKKKYWEMSTNEKRSLFTSVYVQMCVNKQCKFIDFQRYCHME